MDSFSTYPAKTKLFAGRQLRRLGQLRGNAGPFGLAISANRQGRAFSGIAGAPDKAHNMRALP
jgi:hypothetical protein